MKHPHSGKDLGASPADFPALAAFFAAYLHQDFRDEYGSAANAAKQYSRDATPEEVKAVRIEWSHFQSMFAARPSAETQSAIGKLGAAWLPNSEAALAEFTAALNG